jgi:hypothetical protein
MADPSSLDALPRRNDGLLAVAEPSHRDGECRDLRDIVGRRGSASGR